jgi:hypothetical protein
VPNGKIMMKHSSFYPLSAISFTNTLLPIFVVPLDIVVEMENVAFVKIELDDIQVASSDETGGIGNVQVNDDNLRREVT